MNADKRRFYFKTYPFNRVYPVKIFLIGLLLILPFTISAKSLAEYRGNVRSAKISIENLLAPDDVISSYRDYLKLQRETLAQIRADVPISEKIEWQNTTFGTNNQWLADKLDKYEIRAAKFAEARSDTVGNQRTARRD